MNKFLEELFPRGAMNEVKKFIFLANMSIVFQPNVSPY